MLLLLKLIANRVLAPVLDLALNIRWRRTQETMGEDLTQ
jgi:beta-glucosidase-like glycosyl hydrolase